VDFKKDDMNFVISVGYTFFVSVRNEQTPHTTLEHIHYSKYVVGILKLDDPHEQVEPINSSSKVVPTWLLYNNRHVDGGHASCS
jgi:hypothetical protein